MGTGFPAWTDAFDAGDYACRRAAAQGQKPGFRRVAGRVEPRFVERISEMPRAILDSVRDGDVVLTMGAGSIGQVAGGVRELASEAAGGASRD